MATEGASDHRVMLVDDDGVCLAMLARGLRKRGFHVSTFGDPREAVASLATERPDAVITDMRMPHLSGLDVVQEVRARLGQDAPPVLVVSADGEETLLQEAFRLGAVDYLLKPVSDVELGVKLERTLRQRRKDLGLSAIPDRAGEYQLESCVGRGGTACVFRGVRADAPDVAYAVKVIWPHLTANTETLLRFRREIDTLSTLDHPQLVRFVSSGREGECFYYVMEHVEGGTLRSRLRERGPGTPADVLELIEGLAEPLNYLHRQGVVHRDVKPGNIFYGPQGLVLGDFGLARRLVDRGITLADEFIGTPLYLAPEVFQSAQFDHTVDYYSLGVCGLELLNGRPVLQEKDGMRLVGRLVAQGLPEPEEVVPDIPAPLGALIARLISVDPDERPQDAAALLEAVAATRAAL